VEMHASMGVSLFPRDGDDLETLIQHADHAMYQAKSAGKNCYTFERAD
jgi:diguanylate cyclase (GGDEF)-like protein